jgi:Protein of unknown function (DUF1524)
VLPARWVPLVAIVAYCLLVGSGLLAGCVPVERAEPAEPDRVAVPPAAVAQARDRLARLPVRRWSSMRGYSRARFAHWNQHADGCNTRELVLRRSGRRVRTDRYCRARSGRWVSPYDGAVHTAAADLEIDHLVPLANAWRSGAAGWTDTRRGRFANDLRNPELVAVTASVNRSKGDQGPEAWRPPAVGYWCRYAHDWIMVKHAYRLSVTRAERTALTAMLFRC